MQSTSLVQARDGARVFAFAIGFFALAVIALPGLWVALSLPIVGVSVIGGIAVGLSALAARAGRGSEQVEYLS